MTPLTAERLAAALRQGRCDDPPQPLQFSLNDSVLLDICRYERLMHYRTPTTRAVPESGIQAQNGN